MISQRKILTFSKKNSEYSNKNKSFIYNLIQNLNQSTKFPTLDTSQNSSTKSTTTRYLQQAQIEPKRQTESLNESKSTSNNCDESTTSVLILIYLFKIKTKYYE